MGNEKRLLKVHSRPALKEPFLVAAGPGTANVGLRTANYLRERVRAELLAEIEPGDFFVPPYSFVFRDGLIEIVPVEPGENAPQNRFYYWKSGRAHDIIFFTGNAHPLPGKGPELAGYVLEVAREFGMRRLYMPGAFLSDIHHLDEPTICGSSTSVELREYLHRYNVTDAPAMNIAYNLNAWLLGTARRENIDAVGLISEIPAYRGEEANIRACRALAKLLIQMLDIGALDISDLDTMLAEEDALMDKRLAELRESKDEKAIDFLRYIDALEKRSQEMPREGGELLPYQIELPESLNFVEELFARAKSDADAIEELRLAVLRLEAADRLLILRKYGHAIISLLGFQV